MNVSDNNSFNISVIVVAFNPNINQLLELCGNLVQEGAHVIVVDNSEPSCITLEMLPNHCNVINMGANKGIAMAQNFGVDAALSTGAKAIVFLDQDSTLSFGFLSNLVSFLKIEKPGIVSPLCIDDITGAELPFIRLNRLGLPAPIYAGNGLEPIEADIVISSGMAVTSSVFKIVGGFDEGMFIDLVDTDWCIRCRSAGVPIRVIPSVKMRHRIGLKSEKLGPFTVSIHSPARCYYQIRNCFHLFRKSYVSIPFALSELIKVIINRTLLLLVIKGRLPYIRAYARGVKHGFLGIYGR
jgi:rhamnosyltransferase